MNKQIVIAVVIIGGSGVVNGLIAKKPLTAVIMGSYILLLVLSIMDMYGGPLSTLSGAIAMLAATFVVITELPWKTIIGAVQGKKTK